jgi:hypothetical protein
MHLGYELLQNWLFCGPLVYYDVLAFVWNLFPIYCCWRLVMTFMLIMSC